MKFTAGENALIFRFKKEILEITAWGKNSLRIRATENPKFSGENHALEYVQGSDVKITIDEDVASISNGKLKCVMDSRGWLTFFSGEKQILKEYYRAHNGANPHSPCMQIYARSFKGQTGGDYKVTALFEADEKEKIFGMGQYQQPQLNLKGCVLELAQRNSQVSVPFYMSSLGYGFLWNNPAIGEVMFGTNYTKWEAACCAELDYWITAEDTPKGIIENYAQVTGRAPEFPENLLGLWQCKLRYRTQQEVLEVAKEYKRRGIPLDVIVIDFFHWIRQGDWSFDPEYWSEPKAMVQELNSMGVRCMVSVWPTVEERSVNFSYLRNNGLLVRSERGMDYAFQDAYFIDATAPEAQSFLWRQIKQNYYDNGIDLFWLDVAEPEYTVSDFDNYRYYTGPAVKTGNEFPKFYTKAFYNGMREQGRSDFVSLVRSAWAGSQKYSVLVWSGDVRSTFESLRDQLSAGLNIGLAGIPWWVSDTGGFSGNLQEEHFTELLIRWYQFAAFCPVLRMHGDRGPRLPGFTNKDHGGGFIGSGQPNELWSYGEDAFKIMKKYLDIRLSIKDYIKEIMDEASKNGSPLLRTMFYEFPEDARCWETDDQYMFGYKYLVAPVMYQGMYERTVYLPQGEWRNIHTDEVLNGGTEITVPTPLDIIPVYEKIV